MKGSGCMTSNVSLLKTDKKCLKTTERLLEDCLKTAFSQIWVIHISLIDDLSPKRWRLNDQDNISQKKWLLDLLLELKINTFEYHGLTWSVCWVESGDPEWSLRGAKHDKGILWHVGENHSHHIPCLSTKTDETMTKGSRHGMSLWHGVLVPSDCVYL